jgi:hypothetical protein
MTAKPDIGVNVVKVHYAVSSVERHFDVERLILAPAFKSFYSARLRNHPKPRNPHRFSALQGATIPEPASFEVSRL